MIYTCTLNPAIDMFIRLDKLDYNSVNRSDFCELTPNGKGVNVSIILKLLKLDCKNIGFVGGEIGDFIDNGIKEMGIETDFVDIKSNNRINIFINLNGEKELKIVNPGPYIDGKYQNELLDKIKKIAKNDWLIVSGSNPRNIDDSFILEIAKICYERHVNLCMDISSSVVLECAKYRPFLIKPNEDELLSWFNDTKGDIEKYKSYSKKLMGLGVKNVLLTLGSDGGILFNSRETIVADAPKVKVVNTAGSGDTVLGTFIGNMIKGESTLRSFLKSIAAGSETANNSWLISDFHNVEKMVSDINYSIL